MKTLYVSDIRQWAGDAPVERALFALSEIETRKTKDGRPYLTLTLSDKTGSVPGLFFDGEPQGLKVGDAVLVWGSFSPQYSNIKLQRIARYAGAVEPADFLATSARDIAAMQKELRQLIESIANPSLSILLRQVFLEDPEVTAKFPRWAGAKEAHHAYVGGLLEHTLTVAKLCQRSVEFYEMDLDLLLAGALLHDIGKLWEMDTSLAITYTERGNLMGHTLLGILFLREKLRAIPAFPEELARGLLHIISSHQGELEWGAIVKPMTVEAILVSALDYTDSRASRGQALIREQRPQEQSISRYDRFLGGRVYAPKEEL